MGLVKVYLEAEEYAEALENWLVSAGVSVADSPSKADYVLITQEFDGPMYYELQERSTGATVWHSMETWPSYSRGDCQGQARVHFDRVSRLIGGWDGQPAVTHPSAIVDAVAAQTVGASQPLDLARALPVLSYHTQLHDVLPGDVGVHWLDTTPPEPDDYRRSLVGNIEKGDSFEEARPLMRVATYGYGIAQVIREEDTITYAMGSAARWIAAQERRMGVRPMMLEVARPAAIQSIERSYWSSSPAGEVTENIEFDIECAIRFDVRSRQVSENNCPYVESDYDSTFTSQAALVFRVTGVPRTDGGNPEQFEAIDEYDIVAWLDYERGILARRVDAAEDGSGGLLDLSSGGSVPEIYADRPPLTWDNRR